MSTLKKDKKVIRHDAAIDGQEMHTFEGKVVSVTGTQLVMRDTLGRKSSYTVAMNATLTCDGAICQPENLKAGNKIRVTTTRENRNVVSSIESLDTNAGYTQSS